MAFSVNQKATSLELIWFNLKSSNKEERNFLPNTRVRITWSAVERQHANYILSEHWESVLEHFRGPEIDLICFFWKRYCIVWQLCEQVRNFHRVRKVSLKLIHNLKIGLNVWGLICLNFLSASHIVLIEAAATFFDFPRHFTLSVANNGNLPMQFLAPALKGT